MTPKHFDVLAHIESKGDMHAGPGEYAGTRGEKKAMEGFEITFDTLPEGLGLRYRAHIKDHGDTGWVADGSFAGTRGRLWPLLGFHIELTGQRMSQFDVLYMTHVRDSGDTAWQANGVYCGSAKGLPIEGLAVKIVPRKAQYIRLISKASSRSGRPLAITAPDLRSGVAVLVSEPSGSDLQLWDRRAVRGGDGYALISKAHPHLCIARGSGLEAVLMNVAQIATDDACVWTDDSVKGQWNAIRSLTHPELKLNMSGNPPYADKDNALIVYPWSGGAENELWLRKAMSYDLVGGVDEAVFNEVAQAIYAGTYPQIFQGEQPIGAHGIDSVHYDVTTAPVCRIDPDGLPVINTAMDAANPHRPVEADQAAGPVIAIRIEHIGLALQGDLNMQVDGSLDMSAELVSRSGPFWMANLVRGRLRLRQQDPGIEHLLNDWFVPRLLQKFNHEIFGRIVLPFELPPGFAPPLLSAQQPHLLISGSRYPEQAAPPPPAAWPRQRSFVGADEVALSSLAEAALERIRPSGPWDFAMDASGCRLRLEGGYQVHFGEPVFKLLSAADGMYKLEFEVRGMARCEGRCGDWNGRLDASARRRVSAMVRVAAEDDRRVIAVFQSIDDFSLDWTLYGLPERLKEASGKIVRVLDAAVTADARRVLSIHVLELFAMRTLHFGIGDRQFAIALRDVTLRVMTDPDGKALAMMSGAPEVSVIA